jgi:hypothetical protein
MNEAAGNYAQFGGKSRTAFAANRHLRAPAVRVVGWASASESAGGASSSRVVEDPLPRDADDRRDLVERHAGLPRLLDCLRGVPLEPVGFADSGVWGVLPANR